MKDCELSSPSLTAAQSQPHGAAALGRRTICPVDELHGCRCTPAHHLHPRGRVSLPIPFPTRQPQIAAAPCRSALTLLPRWLTLLRCAAAVSLGYNGLGFNGNNHEVKTPTIDALAKSGVILDNHCAFLRTQTISPQLVFH